MSISWRFKKKQPDDTTRDPISGEFFSTEAIRNAAEALVREGIQNSLDARVDGGKVRIRIFLSGTQWAAPIAKASTFLGGLQPHLQARGNGIAPSERPNPSLPCQFLTFEDFGTTGLEGDPLQWHRVEGTQNGLFAFFRAEGENAKSDSGRRGRWGIGKFVFPRASKGSAFFGWTVRRSDARSMLLGRCILKSHNTAVGHHVPDGYFGVATPVPGGTITAPTEDQSVLAAFRDAFSLTRTTEPGLSLVVPWYHNDVTKGNLVDAAIRDWFFCLMSGELEIEICDPSGSVVLNARTIDAEILRLEEVDRSELQPLVALTRFALTEGVEDFAVCGPPDQANSVKWTDEMLPDTLRASLRESLDRGDPIGVRIPLVVRPKGREPQQSHFDVYLSRDADFDAGRPVFVREGIIVTDAKGSRTRGYRSLVISTDKPLADLLGDAENPAHTEWRADTGNFKEKYVYGNSYLTFVKECASKIVSTVEQDEEDVSPDLLSDFFSLPEAPTEARPNRQTARSAPKGEKTDQPVVTAVAKPRKYTLSKVRGGFTITPGRPGAAVPAIIEVRVAYDVRRGDAFRKYDPADFVLSETGRNAFTDVAGLRPLQVSENKARYEVLEPEFRLSMTGFDMNRDLILKIQTPGELNATTTELDEPEED
jgi:hypothetical protein